MLPPTDICDCVHPRSCISLPTPAYMLLVPHTANKISVLTIFTPPLTLEMIFSFSYTQRSISPLMWWDNSSWFKASARLLAVWRCGLTAMDYWKKDLYQKRDCIIQKLCFCSVSFPLQWESWMEIRMKVWNKATSFTSEDKEFQWKSCFMAARYITSLH